MRVFPEVVATLFFTCLGNSPFLLEASNFHFSKPYCLVFYCWKMNCHKLSGLKGHPLTCHGSMGQKSGSTWLTLLPRAPGRGRCVGRAWPLSGTHRRAHPGPEAPQSFA